MSPGARAIVDSVGAQGETKRLLEVRVPDLIDYQDEAYAKRYADVVKRVVAAEQKAVPGKSGLAEAAARYLYKLMAYKDEFEVARLHTDPAFLAKLDAQFKHGYTVKYNLAPPTISKRDPVTGELQKRQFGPWMLTAFKMLAKFKGLRGGALDIFSKTEERRHERQLIEDYIKQLDEIAAKLNAANHAVAVAAGERARRDPRLRPREGAEHQGGEGARGTSCCSAFRSPQTGRGRSPDTQPRKRHERPQRPRHRGSQGRHDRDLRQDHHRSGHRPVRGRLGRQQRRCTSTRSSPRPRRSRDASRTAC